MRNFLPPTLTATLHGPCTINVGKYSFSAALTASLTADAQIRDEIHALELPVDRDRNERVRRLLGLLLHRHSERLALPSELKIAFQLLHLALLVHPQQIPLDLDHKPKRK